MGLTNIHKFIHEYTLFGIDLFKWGWWFIRKWVIILFKEMAPIWWRYVRYESPVPVCTATVCIQDGSRRGEQNVAGRWKGSPSCWVVFVTTRAPGHPGGEGFKLQPWPVYGGAKTFMVLHWLACLEKAQKSDSGTNGPIADTDLPVVWSE